jgi:hypothetical protein
MSRPTPLRFFFEILRPTRTLIAVLLLVLAYAMYIASVGGEEGFDNALALILVTQLLLASTGYRDRLIRGHFDGLLAGRSRRVGIACSHAALSLLPGVALWIACGAAGRVLGHPSFAFTSGGILALADASVIAWTISLWLGKNTGGVLWLVLLFFLIAARQIPELRFAYGTVSEDFTVQLRAAGAAVVLPIAMYGNGGYVEPPVRVLVGIAIAAVFAVGVWTIVRLDAPLKDPS